MQRDPDIPHFFRARERAFNLFVDVIARTKKYQTVEIARFFFFQKPIKEERQER